MPRVVWLLVVARAVNRLGAFTLPFLGLLLVTDHGASLGEVGWVLGAFGLATIPSRLWGGRLADRIGGRATIVGGLLGTAAAQLLVAAAGSLAQVSVAVVVLGLAFEVYEPPSQSLIADVTTPAQRASAYGLFGAAMAVAGMAAGLLAAVLAGSDLRWLFVADAITCLLCAAVVGALLPPGERRTGAADAGVQPWRDGRLLAMLGVGTVFAVVYLQVTITLPLTLDLRGQAPSAIGLLLTVSAATLVVGQPLLRWPLLRDADDFSILAAGFALLGVGLLLTGLVASLPAYVGTTVVWSLGDLLLLGRAYAVVVALAPERGRGRYLAVYGTSWGAAGVAAPVLGTQLLAHGGPGLAWSVLAALCLALAAAQPTLRNVIRSGRNSARSA